MSRFRTLLVLLAGLVVARFALPPQAPSVEVVDAVNGRTVTPIPRSARASVESAPQRPSVEKDDVDVPGNAFPARTAAVVRPVEPAPAPVIRQVPIPTVTAPAPVAAMQTPAFEPGPPPISVVGTWQDDGPPAVFVATPTGTVLARSGTTLATDYVVTGITPADLVLQQTTTLKTFRIAIPAAPKP